MRRFCSEKLKKKLRQVPTFLAALEQVRLQIARRERTRPVLISLVDHCSYRSPNHS
jgi:hypothetical protein